MVRAAAALRGGLEALVAGTFAAVVRLAGTFDAALVRVELLATLL